MLFKEKILSVVKILYLYICMLVFCKYYFVNFDFITYILPQLEIMIPYLGLGLIFIDDKEFTDYRIILLIGFFYLTANTNFNYVNDIIIIILLSVVFSNENPIKVAKLIYIFLCFWLFVSLIGSVSGLLPNLDGFMGGRHHYIFNFTHHNRMALYLFGILALAIYLYKNKCLKSKYLIILGGIISIIYTFFYCDSRTGGIAQLLLIMCFCVDAFIYQNVRLLKKVGNWLRKWSWFVPIGALLLSMVLTVTFQENKIWHFFNGLLSGRLSLQHEYYLNNGFPLLGAGMDFCGYGCDVYDYVDNAFLRYIYENGLIFTLLFLSTISFRLKKILNSNKDIYIIYFIFIYALIGISEWIFFIYCPFIFLIFCKDNYLKENPK